MIKQTRFLGIEIAYLGATYEANNPSIITDNLIRPIDYSKEKRKSYRLKILRKRMKRMDSGIRKNPN